ncbi:S8 family peptidase [Bacillaceae bacterium W0354]
MKKTFVALLTLLFISFISMTSFGETENEEYFSVVLNNNAKVEQFMQDLASTNAEVVYEVPEIGYYQVKGTKSDLNQIKGFKTVTSASRSVSWSSPEFKRVEFAGDLNLLEEDTSRAMPAFWDIQWDIKRITENGASFDLHTGSHDTVVAVIDTGINPFHIDLAPNLVAGSKNFVPAGGFRGEEPYETGDPNNFIDLHGHGSHVSGSIAGAGNGMYGVAPDLGIRAYRVFGTSSAESAWIYKAMIAAADDGSDVLSMSLGGINIFGQIFVKNPDTGKWENAGNDVADYIAYKRAVKYVEDKGAIVVTSSGNDALDVRDNKALMEFINAEYGSDEVQFRGTAKTLPAELPGVINVSATGPNDVLAVYSNYGSGAIDIAAVGGDTRLYDQYAAEGRLDEYLANNMHYNEFTLSADNASPTGYYFSVGTSMATPKVSAVVGLIIDQHGGKLKPSQVKHLLFKKGVDAVKGKDRQYFGNGHLNAYKALQ